MVEQILRSIMGRGVVWYQNFLKNVYIYIYKYKVVDEFKATIATKSTVVDEFTVRLYKATSFFVF